MEISSHSARSHWLLRGHMTSNNQTVSRQKALSARMLTDDRRYSLTLQLGLMNLHLQNFQLYNKSLKDWFLGRQIILFPSNINVTKLTISLGIDFFTTSSPVRGKSVLGTRLFFSSGILRRLQNFESFFRIKSDTAVLSYTFPFLSSFFFHFYSLPRLFVSFLLLCIY